MARTLTHGRHSPVARLNNASGTRVPHKPQPARESTAISDAQIARLLTVTASIHCGSQRVASHAVSCTPVISMPELIAKSKPYCWAVKPNCLSKRKGDVDRYANSA